MSLKKKMITGAFWSLLEKGGQQGLSLIVFLVLARILGPEDYGLANICFIFFTLTTMVTAGLVDGIVSKQIDDEIRLSSLFWGVNAIGLGISILCLILAVPLSILMTEPKLIQILIWFSIAPLLVSLYSIPNTLLLKELDFKIYAIRSIFSTLIGGAVGVYMALKNYGPFAIVGQQIFIYVINNIIVWKSIKWRPKMIFSKIDFNQTIKPGLSVMGSNVLGFVDGQLPRLLIGTILGAGALGYFALATRLRFSISEMLIQSPFAVVYPTLAKMSNNKEKQLSIAGLVIYTSGLIVFPVLSIAVATAPQYVPLLFGDSWSPAVPILQVYIALLIAMPTLNIIQQLFRANNNMHFFFKKNFYFVIANLLMGLFLFFENGLFLMSIGIFTVTILSIPIYIKLLDEKIQVNLSNKLLQLWVPISAAITAYFSINLFQTYIRFTSNPWVLLSSCILIGFIVYLIICLVFNYNKIVTIYGQLTNLKK
jgi:O-antigen/teichoic acid export membrane protein